MRSFFQTDQKSSKLDECKELSYDEKKESSDLIYVHSSEDVLKEAVNLLKKCSPESIKQLLQLIGEVSTESYPELVYKMQLLKALLQTTKLSGKSNEEVEVTHRKEQIECFEKIVNECLQKFQTLSAESLEGSQSCQQKCVEVLGLLMILDIGHFDRYIDIFIKAIENERAELHKSKSVGIMLKAIFDALRVHCYLKMSRLPNIDADDTDKLDSFNKKKLRLRQLLLRQFRDADYNVRLVSTEGFCRMLMS